VAGPQLASSAGAAGAAAVPEHAPAWIADALRALNAAMHGLDAIESQRRLALRAMAERTRAQQERREALQDALAEVSDTQARAEVAARAAAAQLADARAREVGALFAHLHAARVMDLQGRLADGPMSLLDGYRKTADGLRSWVAAREADGLGHGRDSGSGRWRRSRL
jgi:hypothetical protein